MSFENSALVLIDWQQSFRLDTQFWGPRNNPSALANAEALTTAWRVKGQPVYVVKHMSVTPGSPLSPDSPGNALEPFAVPQPGEKLYEKSVNSGFIGTDLEADLKAAGISKLVIIGVTTAHCVSTTTRMAANLGFGVTLIEDACFTHQALNQKGKPITAEMMHETQIAALNEEFAQISTTSAFLSQL